MLSREMRRNERIMAIELERALDSFAALEEEAIQRHHHHQQRHRQRLDRYSHEARPQEIKREAVKPQEIKKEAAKPQENKADFVKAQENKADSVKPQQAESKKEQSVQAQQQYQRRGDVFSPWNNSIDDFFFRDVSPFGNYRYRSPFDDFHSRMNSMERLADEMGQMRAEVDSHFKNPEAPQEYPKLAENTSYFMRVETNDNGNVRVKTVQKNPGSEWVTKFEEYKRNNNAAVEKEASHEAKQAVENKGEKLETSGKREEKPVEIKEEPYKASESSATSASA